MRARTYSRGKPDLRVLVVDDDDGLKLLISRMIESGGYQVVSADNGADALTICRNADPPIDLLVTDYKMPGMTGLDLARECSRANGELSVLYVSGSPASEELRADLAARRRGFLAKPFRKTELLGRVKSLLEVEPDAARTEHTSELAAAGAMANGVSR
jgi:two-component system, OmpR family, response regulator